MATKMALEQKIDMLVSAVGGLSDAVNRLDGQIAELKADFGELRGEFGDLKADFGELRGEFGSLKAHFGELTGEFGSLKAHFGELSSKVSVGFEESHRLLKLSLEGLGALDQTTVARFDRMSDDHARQFDLLERFGVHVRRRVERLEAPAAQRRR